MRSRILSSGIGGVAAGVILAGHVPGALARGVEAVVESTGGLPVGSILGGLMSEYQRVVDMLQVVFAELATHWDRVDRLLAVTTPSIIPIFALLSAACFFSLSETAITTLWPWKIKEMAMQQGPNERIALDTLRKNITRFLTTILIGGTLANIAVAAMITELSMELFGPVGVSIATAVSSILIVLLCEIAPKAIAVQYPQAILRAVVGPLNLIAKILYPLGHACTGLCNALLRPFGILSSAPPVVTGLELRMVLEGAEDSGQVTDVEADMVEKVLQLGDTTVESVMTPLVDVVAIDQNATLYEMVELWKKYQYSRVPVYSQRVDNLVGVAFTKDILNFAERPINMLHKAKVRHIMVQPPFFVPESMTTRKLLQEFQTRKFHMAVVVNEYGGVAGVVTLEDVLEEIVGEIFDETDIARPAEAQGIVRWGDGIWYMKGDSPIDLASEALGAEFPKGSHETIAGFVTRRFGRIPQVGESFEEVLSPLEDASDSNGNNIVSSRRYLFKVVSTNNRQVIEIRVDLLPENTNTSSGGSAPSAPPNTALPAAQAVATATNSSTAINPFSLPPPEFPLETETDEGRAGLGLSSSPPYAGDNQGPLASGSPFTAAALSDDGLSPGYAVSLRATPKKKSNPNRKKWRVKRDIARGGRSGTERKRGSSGSTS